MLWDHRFNKARESKADNDGHPARREKRGPYVPLVISAPVCTSYVTLPLFHDPWYHLEVPYYGQRASPIHPRLFELHQLPFDAPGPRRIRGVGEEDG